MYARAAAVLWPLSLIASLLLGRAIGAAWTGGPPPAAPPDERPPVSVVRRSPPPLPTVRPRPIADQTASTGASAATVASPRRPAPTSTDATSPRAIVRASGPPPAPVGAADVEVLAARQQGYGFLLALAHDDTRPDLLTYLQPYLHAGLEIEIALALAGHEDHGDRPVIEGLVNAGLKIDPDWTTRWLERRLRACDMARETLTRIVAAYRSGRREALVTEIMIRLLDEGVGGTAALLHALAELAPAAALPRLNAMEPGAVDAALVVAIARAAAELGQTERAVDLLRTAHVMEPTATEPVVELARYDLDASLAILDERTGEWQDDELVHVRLLAFEQAGLRGDVLAEASALAVRGEDPWALSAIAEWLEELDEHDAAEALFVRAHELSPLEPEHAWSLSSERAVEVILSDLRRGAGGLPLAREGISALEAWIDDDPVAAVPHLRGAVNALRPSPEWHVWVADTISEDFPVEAIALLTRALELDARDHAGALQSLVALDQARALGIVIGNLERDPRSALRAAEARGLLQSWASSDPAAARAHVLRLAERVRPNARWGERVAKDLTRAGFPDDAVALLERIAEVSPADAERARALSARIQEKAR